MAQPARKLYDNTAPVRREQERKQQADLQVMQTRQGHLKRLERVYSMRVVAIVASFVFVIGAAVCFSVYAGQQVDAATVECADANNEYEAAFEEYKAYKNKLDSLTTNEKLRAMAEKFDMVAITAANSHAAGYTSPEQAKAEIEKKAKKAKKTTKTKTAEKETAGTAGASGSDMAN